MTFTPAQMSGAGPTSKSYKKEEKPLAWDEYAAWKQIPASYRERVKAKWLEEWGEGNEDDIGAYVNNWLANNKSKNIDKAGDIIDKQKSLVADEENLKRLHDSLKKQGFIDGDALDYDKFREHAVNNPDYRMKLHAVIRDSGLNTDIDYNTFNKSVFGDETTVMPEDSNTGEIEIEGVPIDIQKQLNNNKIEEGTSQYQRQLIAQQEAYNEIFKGGADAIPLKPDGTIDYDALNEKIKEIKGFAPRVFDVTTDDLTPEEVEFFYNRLDELKAADPTQETKVEDNIAEREELLKAAYNQQYEDFMEGKAMDPGMDYEAWKEKNKNNRDIIGYDLKTYDPEAPMGISDYAVYKEQALQEIFDQRSSTLDAYYNGEVDLSSAKLAQYTTINPEVKDYIMGFMPENSQLKLKEDFLGTVNPETQKKYTDEEAEEAEYRAFNDAYRKTFDDALHTDPRYEFALMQAQEATNKLSEDYINKLREKYADENGLVSEENLVTLQQEYTDWYNQTTQQNLKDNKVAKQLFQDYGIASGKLYGDRFRSFEKYTYDTWLDDNVYREIDESLSKDQSWWNKAWQKVRASAASVPSGIRTVSNTLEIAAQKEFELEGRSEIYNSIKDGLDTGQLTEDMTLSEARELNSEIDSWMNWNILSGWSDDDRLSDFYAKRKERYDNTVRDLTEDLGDLTQQERYAGFAADYADIELDGPMLADWVVNSSADMIKQSPHMVPSTLGGLLIAAGTVSTATGAGAIPGGTLIGAGKGLLALGSGVMASQVYADVYMQGLRRQMESEYGEGGFSTEEYLEALANDDYGSQMPALTAAVMTGASEYVFGKFGGQLTGNIAGNILKSTAGNKILGATFANYARGLGAYAVGTTVDGVIEGATEGFQSYMAQVAENAMNLYKGDMENEDTSSIFYKNINIDEIMEEAKMGFNMGIFMGAGGIMLGNSGNQGDYQNLNYEGRAMEIANTYDISTFQDQGGGSGGPGGGISGAANSAFLDIQEAIKQDATLTPVQKRNKIQVVSDIREAAIKIPSFVKGNDKKTLIDLIREKKVTKSEIKKINDKTISSAQGLEGRLSEIDTDIADIIENNKNNKTATRQSIIPPKVMDAIFNNISRFAGVQNLVDPRDHSDYVRRQQKRDMDTMFGLDDRRDPPGASGVAVIDNLIEQNREIGNRILRARNQQQLEARKAEIQNLETQNSADELRAQLENATGENRENIELALQEKFKNFPQAVEDAGIDVITGQEAAGGPLGPDPIDGRTIIEQADKRKRRQELAGEAIQQGRDKTPSVTDIVARDDSYRAIDRLMNDPDFDVESTLDQRRALKAAAPVIEATLKRLYRPGSLLTREQFRKALENLYIETLLKYDSDLDANQQGPGQQTSNLFNIKAGAIARENLGKGERASLDREDARQIADTTQEQDLDQDETVGTREKVYSSQTDQVQDQDVSETKAIIKDELQKDILLSAAKGDNAATTASKIKENAKRSYFKQLRKDIGTFASQAYKDFVNAIDQAFIKSVPAATIKRRFGKLFGIKQIGTTPTKQVGKTGKMSYFDKPIYSIPQITDQGLQEFKDYFLAGEKRQQSLYQILANDFALESINELMQDKDFMDKLNTALADSGITAVEFMESLENKLDPRTKEDTSLDVVDAPVQEAAAGGSPTPGPIDGRRAIKETDKKKSREQLAKERLQKKIDKAKNKVKLEDSDTYFEFTRDGEGTSLSSILGFKKIPTKKEKYIGQRGKTKGQQKQRTVYDLDQLSEIASKEDASTKLTFRELREQGINEFLDTIEDSNKRKKYTELLKSSMTGSKRLNFNTVSEFDNAIPGAEGSTLEQNRTRYKNKKGTLDTNAADIVYSEQNLDDVLDLFDDLGSFLREGDNMKYLPVFDSIIDDSGNNMNHMVRIAAPYAFYPIDINTGKPDFTSRIDEEHSLPAQNLARLLLYAAATDQMSIVKPVVKGSYIQGAMLATEHATLANQGLKSKMNEAFNLVFTGLRDGNISKVYQGLGSLVRYTDSNVINPNQYILTKHGVTIAEYYGVQVDKRFRKVPNVIEVQNQAITRLQQGENKATVLKDFAVSLQIAKDAAAQNLNIQEYTQQILEKRCTSPCRVPRTSKQVKKTLLNSLIAKIKGLKIFKQRKGLSAFDMDDTLALTKEKVLYTMPDGTKGELTAGEFAVEYESLSEQGAEFDYRNFDNVDLSTEKGPLAGTALRRQGKYGPKDIYVVTARPGAAQESIKVFLDNIGLNIPLENIITLEDGSPQAKADWFISKAAEGYNDFYFADDSALNVQQVKDILSQLDVKSRVQQAIADKATRLDQEMNEILEDKTGIKADEDVSDVRAKLEGKKKDKGFFRRLMKQLTITASADDFLGLVQYIVGKGETGTRQQKWIRDNLIVPYNKAEQALISAKINVAKDFNALKQAFPTLRNKKGLKGMFSNPLNDDIGVGPYNKSQAVRVYLWNKQGMEIPGMSQADIDALVEAVSTDYELKQFADNIQLIQKEQQYPAPTAYWIAGDIKSDILGSLDKAFRKELLTEWKENVDIIFSPKNMNKLEAAFGSKYVEALRDSLRRMETGTNRPTYQGSFSRGVNEMMDWLNGSVAVAMFLNVRSGTLQMLSNVNFINWGDNNIYAAAKAFLSKDYVPTVMELMNSDYLVNRRDGLKINVNEAELAAAAKKGGFKGMLSYLLDKGFVLTRIFDSLAIATGGATFYMNRQKSLLNRINEKTGKKYTKAEAKQKAFDDFYDIAEETQQSSNPSKISSQQASLFGRLILSFQNVTMQYNRKAKKMLLDLVNRRRRPGMTQRESDLSNLSGVIYYVGVQNLVFNSLQQALFAVAFEDEEEKDRNKTADTINGMVDSILFGLGFGGAIISTVKNVIRELDYQAGLKTPEYEEALFNLFDISPVIDQKVRNIRNGLRTFSWNMADIKKRGWSLDNPAYIAISSVISAATNIPVDRLFRKINNIRQATDENVRTFERVALLLGWNGWNFGLPYWGRESTIKKEEAELERLKKRFTAQVKYAKSNGFTKRVPFTGKNSWSNGIPKGLKEGVDYIAIERYDGIIQYYKKP